MKAVGYFESLPIESDRSLVDLDLPSPTPGDRDLLVRVEAVGVNPVDVKIRRSGTPNGGTPRILGWDAAGIVEAVGADVTGFRPGDAVFYAGDLNRSGANSERHVVDERIVGHKPKSLTYSAAAVLPLTSLTAWELLFDRLDVPRGPEAQGGRILIINGAGGVGSILIQLARQLTGLTVIATASRPETIAWVRRMGAHHVIDHNKPLDEGLDQIGIPDVGYVASLTGTEGRLADIIKILAPQGKLAVIDDPSTLDVAGFKRKSLSLHWEFMFTRSMYATSDIAEQGKILRRVADLVDTGVLTTTLKDDLGPINASNMRLAHAQLESRKAFGKLALSGF